MFISSGILFYKYLGSQLFSFFPNRISFNVMFILLFLLLVFEIRNEESHMHFGVTSVSSRRAKV